MTVYEKGTDVSREGRELEWEMSMEEEYRDRMYWQFGRNGQKRTGNGARKEKGIPKEKPCVERICSPHGNWETMFCNRGTVERIWKGAFFEKYRSSSGSSLPRQAVKIVPGKNRVRRIVKAAIRHSISSNFLTSAQVSLDIISSSLLMVALMIARFRRCR